MAVNDPLALIQYLQDNSGGGKPPSASSQLNYQQDLMSSLFDPKFAAAYGMFDPVGLAPLPFDFATPVLTGALNSATPVWRIVAQQISDGTIDRQNAISAVAEALGVDEYSTAAGLNLKSIESDIDAIFNEVGDKGNAAIQYQSDMREAEQENLYGKAGLRQPYEQYTMQDAPFSQDLYNQQSELQKMVEMLSLSSDKARQQTGVDTQAIYTKMMEQEPASVTGGQSIAGGSIPKSEEEAVALAKKLNVPEEFMRSLYAETLGLETVTDAKGGKQFLRVPTFAEKEKAFKDQIAKYGRQDRGSGMITNYDKLDKYFTDTRSDKEKNDADQAGRRGIAMSYEAGKQAKDKEKDTYRRIAGERFATEQRAREIDARKMAQLQNLIDAGRTPLGDQLSERMALFGLGNNL